MESEFQHQSVLLDETIENLHIQSNGIYLDGTLGGAGHSREICRHLDQGRLIGIDQDADAILAATRNLAEFSEKVTIVRKNYCEFESVLDELEIRFVDGILLDLGVSSFQLDSKERGFSYREDMLLDMRMDDRNEKSAKDIINNYSETELYHMIRDFGEDKFAKNIAKHIIRMRSEKSIETTFELTEAIKSAIPAKLRVGNGHPSKRTFQAIRIELNRELEVLEYSLDRMIERLKPGGRFCVITFHSLEDRMVKKCFRRNENPCTCPHNFPSCVCGKKPKGKQVVRKAIFPSKEELEANTRSKSAKLRVFERI